MLQVTDSAAEAVKAMLAEAELPDGAGLRIAVDEAEDAVDLLLEDAAAEGDSVVTQDGAQVFLDATAAAALADKVLDAQGHDDHFHFELLDQEA
jgi:Fe-S cluster assembly iron-binding protein IscA